MYTALTKAGTYSSDINQVTQAQSSQPPNLAFNSDVIPTVPLDSQALAVCTEQIPVTAATEQGLTQIVEVASLANTTTERRPLPPGILKPRFEPIRHPSTTAADGTWDSKTDLTRQEYGQELLKQEPIPGRWVAVGPTEVFIASGNEGALDIIKERYSNLN